MTFIDKTHDGLDIILDYYPQAEGCVDNKKKFKRRPEEDDASACIKKFKVNNDYEVYKVTDFGDQSTAMSPLIFACMKKVSLFQKRFLSWQVVIM